VFVEFTSENGQITASHATPPEDRPTPRTPVVSSPPGLLEPGAARAIQEKLASAGLVDDKAISGELDASTEEALRFQRRSDLPATGVPDEATVRKARPRPAPRVPGRPRPALVSPSRIWNLENYILHKPSHQG
jgi:hypothetical protein